MNSRKRFSQALVQQDRFPTDEEWAADYDALAAENAELRRCLDGGFDCAGERMRLAAELAEVKADRQAIWAAASKREARRDEPNYNVPPWHLSKIVPGCRCDGCRKQSDRGAAK